MNTRVSQSQAEPSRVAVVLAGGVGQRMGVQTPKQFLRVAGKPIIEHTLIALQRCNLFDDIIVLLPASHVSRLRALQQNDSFPAFRTVLTGGRTRAETSRVAIDWLLQRYPGDTRVFFHDAVRPFIPDVVLRRIDAAFAEATAIDTVIPSADTIVEVEDEWVVSIPDRSRLRRGQTPQAFLLDTIAAAYVQAEADPSFTSTDDCSVVLKYLPGTPVKTVLGDDANMKVTEPIDLDIADKLFQLRARASEERLAPERQDLPRRVLIVGGSSGIGAALADQLHERGCEVSILSRTASGTDVLDRSSVRAGIVREAARLGGIDAVVNCAGVLHVGEFATASDDEIAQELGVNLRGAIVVAQEVFPHLCSSCGQLVLFSSSSYTRGRADYALYSATKAAIVNLTQALADEWAEAGIRVNCVSPQRTRTPMREQAFGAEPAESLLTADKVATETVHLLASSMTGQVVDVRLAS